MKYKSFFPVLLAAVVLMGCFYEKTKYHIFYHSSGSTEGTPPKDSREYASGKTAVVLGQGNLVNNGYTFLGWRYFDTLYYSGDFITVHYDDINLYAVWDDGLNTPFEYRVENNEIIITHYNEYYSDSVTIPDTLQSMPVTAIDDNVFSNLSISAIKLPARLERIGIGAFASNNITTLLIPDNVELIRLGSFRNNSLTKITLGTGIIAIEPYAFANNKLTDVTIPENITIIEEGVFHENEINLIKIGAGVEIKNNTALGAYGESFKEYYDLDKQAGTYLYIDKDTGWKRY